jgi:hypothetical protein
MKLQLDESQKKLLAENGVVCEEIQVVVDKTLAIGEEQ